MKLHAPPTTARQVADYFLSKVDEEVGDNLSNLKLQKLLYYAQGFHLAVHGRPLFDDEIAAWRYGPVVPGVYHEFEHHRAGALPPPSADFDPEAIPADSQEILDEVFTVYGQFSALRLMEMTREEPPWADTPLGRSIPAEVMTSYFKTLVVDGQR